MEAILKNMDTVLLKMENELKRNNSPAVKTLVNTYKELFNVVDLIDDRSSEVEDKLNEQLVIIKQLADVTNSEISGGLNRGDYKHAHSLAFVYETLVRLQGQIKGFINKYAVYAPNFRKKNLMQIIEEVEESLKNN
ncbi:hypothetical protein [Cytobacillus gottheilii]|uniref:hypothetical protein n=1 Tax=Cytobacillus gottheilii TaxID=859144 RepID=UPI0009BC51CE|nr:hypothetical protein [Cytobacillus gottheilii]